MTTKLTLTIEKNVIEKAKKYAKKNGHSLSDLIENYLKVVTVEEEENKSEFAPITKSLKGSFKKPSDFNYKKLLTGQLSEKYLK